MTELRVWVNSRGVDPQAATTLVLRTPTREKDVAQRSFRNFDLAASNWLTLRFPAERDSSGQLYILTATGSSADGIRLGYSEKPEYLKGRLTENGSPQGSDILFQYGCVAGLQSLASTPR